MLNITLREHQFLHCKKGDQENKRHYIIQKSFDELEAFVLRNMQNEKGFLQLSTKKGYGKVLQAKQYVGVIQTKQNQVIEILPKINLQENELEAEYSSLRRLLIKMLKTLKNSPFKNFNMANLKSDKLTLFEVFIGMFLDELTKLVQKGLKSEYIYKEENAGFLKGKLKVSENIKHNYIHKERFFIAYDEFTSDRVENRLIKTTLQFLYKKSSSYKNQQRIREFLFTFDEVQYSKNFKVDFSRVKLNRQMKGYEVVLTWCKTFLLEHSYSPYKGNDVAFALLFDMNRLFESYVGAYLKKNCHNVHLQDASHYLACQADKPYFKLRPDYIINCASNKPLIADAKWKNVKEGGRISERDVYQMFVYGKKYGSENVYLIYPDEGQSVVETYILEEGILQLDVLFFDIKNEKFKYKNNELALIKTCSLS